MEYSDIAMYALWVMLVSSKNSSCGIKGRIYGHGIPQSWCIVVVLLDVLISTVKSAFSYHFAESVLPLFGLVGLLQFGQLCLDTVSHAGLSHAEISTEASKCTLQWIFEQPVMIEPYF